MDGFVYVIPLILAIKTSSCESVGEYRNKETLF